MSTGTSPVRAGSGQAAKMPAFYRKLTLVGALVLLAGAVLGQFVFGGITLAAAGLGIVAAAACHNGQPGWRQPLVLGCAAVGAVFTVLTGLYWQDISRRIVLGQQHQPTTAADGTLALLLGSGTTAVAVLGVLVLLAYALRVRARRMAVVHSGSSGSSGS
ncbi:hypothetical protein IV498_03090 [Paenarthrobacter sp. Z7-10]|uniref:hypothetical protein n=1 Tax=Paenarthrobacter sp. Z7-10 TaxID=2787635 RepID=UPI0022A93E95|nr:hypothetical protein [Paenarthrobacter sp. Z7-10]MCZ2402190.1 hypothetical protein [Paenarthrobacter sp. Z7-10]